MATINYNGMELDEFITYTPIAFEKPKKAVVWDDGNPTHVCNVFAVVPYMNPPVLTESRDGRQDSSWFHCAFLPDQPKPRRATNRELSRWLAQGNGEFTDPEAKWYSIYTAFAYGECHDDKKVDAGFKVRKWSDTEWHEPTVDYLFGGDDADR